jgi:hypothetical protein
MEFEKNQRTFPLSFWFFVSTFVKTVSSLKYLKNLEPEVLLTLKVFKKREPGGSAILKFKEE